MNFRFFIKNKYLLLEYFQYQDIEWLQKKLNNGEKQPLRKTFYVTKSNLYENKINKERALFKIAILENDYFKFDKDVLQIDKELYINKDFDFKEKYFVTDKNTSIFSYISRLIDDNTEVIKIGDTSNDLFTIEEFKSLIKCFPTRTEVNYYFNTRVGNAIKDFVDLKKNYEEIYTKYMNKKESIKKEEDIYSYFKEYEIDKYEKILEKLKQMLEDNSYSEDKWQKEILKVIRLLYPKYVCEIEKVRFEDVFTNKHRELDILLVDSSGNIDIIEIKKPFDFDDYKLLNKRKYRDNYIPARELTGSIMQIEKYIYYLNKLGVNANDKLSEKYKDKLPDEIEIKITNPNGIIIMGRKNHFSLDQKNDFEIIKRKYKNIIDIITYDDLINRLENMLISLKKD